MRMDETILRIGGHGKTRVNVLKSTPRQRVTSDFTIRDRNCIKFVLELTHIHLRT